MSATNLKRRELLMYLKLSLHLLPSTHLLQCLFLNYLSSVYLLSLSTHKLVALGKAPFTEKFAPVVDPLSNRYLIDLVLLYFPI